MTNEERKEKILAVLRAHESVVESEITRMDVGGMKARALIAELQAEGNSITCDVIAQGKTVYRLGD